MRKKNHQLDDYATSFWSKLNISRSLVTVDPEDATYIERYQNERSMKYDLSGYESIPETLFANKSNNMVTLEISGPDLEEIDM